MGRKRNNGLSEEKRDIIGQLIEMYDIKTAADRANMSYGIFTQHLSPADEANIQEEYEKQREASVDTE